MGGLAGLICAVTNGEISDSDAPTTPGFFALNCCLPPLLWVCCPLVSDSENQIASVKLSLLAWQQLSRQRGIRGESGHLARALSSMLPWTVHLVSSLLYWTLRKIRREIYVLAIAKHSTGNLSVCVWHRIQLPQQALCIATHESP